MKRGKDDEKMMGPLFPRFHVNDTDKGGPRPPPRNKMALYEQLSIPSQRFNHHGMSSLNGSSTSSLVPPGISIQGNGVERNLRSQHQVLPSKSIYPAEKFHAQKPYEASLNNISLARNNQSKKVGDEDDFMVPVFVNSGMAQSHSRTKNDLDKEKLTPINPASSCCSIGAEEIGVKDSKQKVSLSPYPRQEVRDQNEENPKVCLVVNSLADVSTRAEVNRDKLASKYERLNDSDACLRQVSRNRFDQDGRETGEKVESSRDAYKVQMRSKSHSGDEVDNGREYCSSRTCVSPQQRIGDASDGVSDTSMVDSLSRLDFSSDDIVGIIGQKHFWKARRAIANQQRSFAVQVFELHRLIKVQRLIAGSPHLLLEESAYLRKSSSKTSPAKKLFPPEYVVKSLPHVIKCKDDSQRVNKNDHKIECSAENTVRKATSLSSGKNNNHQQPSNYPPIINNPPNAPAGSNTQIEAGASWCFPPQPPPSGNHQWLIPVMSSSEGLVYKPYPAPGFIGSVCGGYYGHFAPMPMAGGNFVSSAYGIPASPYQQGVSYVPHYSMPGMNSSFSSQPTEQINQFGCSSNLPKSVSMQQSSCNIPNPKNGDVSLTPTMKYQPGHKATTQVQGSTGTSPSRSGNTPEHVFPLHPTAPIPHNGKPGTCVDDQPRRVIRVVPHKPTLATESAARIFQSIQEERKQYDLV